MRQDHLSDIRTEEKGERGMKYISISEPIFYDLLSAKAQVNDIRELVNDYSFRPTAREWKVYLNKILNVNKYGHIEEDEDEQVCSDR